jgi:hypothetical protein
MASREIIYKDGILISDIDNRVLSEEIDFIKSSIRQEAAELLSKTDWMVIRAMDGVPIPDSISEYRKAVREISNRICVAIDASKSLDDLDLVDKSIVGQIESIKK